MDYCQTRSYKLMRGMMGDAELKVRNFEEQNTNYKYFKGDEQL